MESEATTTTGELYAQSFDNSDQQYRDERSIFRGRGKVFQRNIFRHLSKALTVEKTQKGGKFVAAALKVMMACSLESYGEKLAPEPEKIAPVVKLPRLQRGATMPAKKMKLLISEGTEAKVQIQEAKPKSLLKRRNSESNMEENAPNMLQVWSF